MVARAPKSGSRSGVVNTGAFVTQALRDKLQQKANTSSTVALTNFFKMFDRVRPRSPCHAPHMTIICLSLPTKPPLHVLAGVPGPVHVVKACEGVYFYLRRKPRSYRRTLLPGLRRCIGHPVACSTTAAT